MKRLTLNKAWELCLEQRGWIAEQWKKPLHATEKALKRRWSKEHGFEEIQHNCFFCEYDRQHKGCCMSCPAILVDKEFSHCSNSLYHHSKLPVEFNDELLRLHKIYLKRKKK